MLSGIITHIQRFSLHDGPGIRSTIFLKGCNMRCAWCHNPETIHPEPEYLLHPEKCIHCGQCADGCFAGARVLCGQAMTVAQVLAEALQDRQYFGETGGVTLSGGEPTYQLNFTKALLAALNAEDIRTGIETNLLCSPEAVRLLNAHCDCIMADLKAWDDERHRLYTGASNQQTLANLQRIERPLIVRTPIIPGINDSREEIAAIADFVGKLPTLRYYELLPYHPLGTGKGTAQQRFDIPSIQSMEGLAETAAEHCASVWIAGRAYKEEIACH